MWFRDGGGVGGAAAATVAEMYVQSEDDSDGAQRRAQRAESRE